MLCRGLRALHGPIGRLHMHVAWRRRIMSGPDVEVAAVTRRLMVEAPKNEAEYAEFRARVVVAEEHLEEGRFAEAVAEYEAVARAFPPNFYFSELYVGLGTALAGLGQHAHAVTVFDRA